MKTPRAIIVIIAAVFCVVVVHWGCDSGSKAPSKPKVVRKKIVSDTQATAAPVKTGANRPGRTQPPPRPKSDIAKAAAPRPATQAPAAAAAPAATVPNPKSDLAVAVSPAPRSTVSAQKPRTGDATDASGSAPKTKPSPAADAPPVETKPAVTAPTVAAPPQKPAPGSGPERPAGTVPAGLTQGAADKKAPAGEPPPPEPYNPQGRIDPFEPLYKDEPEIPAAKQTERVKRVPRTPLERIDLGQLKLVGIITAPSGNRALVQEASGKGYIIKEGTYIGLNSGRVVQIEKDRVIIEEEFEDIVGKISTRKKEITLPKPPGE